MASLSLCPQFETNLMSNRKVIELLLQLKSAKAHGKIYRKVKSDLFHHILRNRLLAFAFLIASITLKWTSQIHSVIKAVLGMLARGTEAWKYGPMAEEAGSACDCKTKH